jgi:opacity protein-like surface antigen
MASFNFGGQKLRGFCNLGVYGGYWLSSHIDGVQAGYIDGIAYPLDTKVEFMSERDNRWDCGLAGGLGLEYRFDCHWIMQAEARCYYSTTSTVKDYQQKRQTRYNTTIGLQAGVAYCF